VGIIICKKHGQAGIVETCQHVANEIDNKRYGQFHYAGTLLVCEECLHQYHLERFENNSLALGHGIFGILEDEELTDAFFDIYEQFQERTVRCSQCIAVAKVEQARKNGEPDPFPTYDKTLNSHDLEIVEELYHFLTTNFRFQKSTVVDNRFAVFIEPGGYTYPLTVKIYYVRAESAQSQVVNLIDNFFQGQELNQVKVKFLEAEVWETRVNPETGLSSGKRGEERLLKEVLLNC
jgi:hypothetical protein